MIIIKTESNENINFNKDIIFILFIKFKIIIILAFNFIFLSIIIIIQIELKNKTCICTLGKQENKYIREFVEYYNRIGVDKIYLYDNNDIKGEKFENVIFEYIKSGYVEIIHWRGKKLSQLKAMNDCYKKNYNKYDWLLFYDIDEYISIINYSNIKHFLNEKKFFQCQLIYLNLIPHTDNNQIYYQNNSLFERFPERVSREKPEGKRLEIKFILKGHIPNIKIKNQHYCNYKLKNCNGFGKMNSSHHIYTNTPDYKYYYIDHFFSKSTEELVDKLIKGDCRYSNFKKMKMRKISRYFNQSEVNKEKIEMIEKRLKIKLNSSKYTKIFIH